MTTFAHHLETPAQESTNPAHQWVADILKDEQIQLSKAKRLTPYGRAKLSPIVRRLMWAMRIYVLASFFLIALQLAISLKAQQNIPIPTPAALIVPAMLSGQDAAH